MEKKPFIKSKVKKIFLWLLGVISTLIILLGCFILSTRLFLYQRKPFYQPELTNKEKTYFREIAKKNGWNKVERFFQNTKDDDFFRSETEFQNQDYEYSFEAGIEDSAVYYSLPPTIEDSIATQLYQFVIERTPKLRRISIYLYFNGKTDENADLSYSREKEYDVRGQQLIRIK